MCCIETQTKKRTKKDAAAEQEPIKSLPGVTLDFDHPPKGMTWERIYNENYKKNLDPKLRSTLQSFHVREKQGVKDPEPAPAAKTEPSKIDMLLAPVTVSRALYKLTMQTLDAAARAGDPQSPSTKK